MKIIIFYYDFLSSLVYPMDYYSNEGGEWTSYHHRQKDMKKKKQHVELKLEENAKV